MTNIDTKPAIAFIGAHPDDIACAAGTLLLLKEQYRIHDLCLTRGQRGFPDPAAQKGTPSAELAARRTKEEEAVCEMLDAELTWFDEMDGELFAGKECCERVAQTLAQIKPVAVFTHFPMEKPDHAAASLIARMALHLADLYWATELYFGSFLGEHHTLPTLDIFVNISAVMDAKREILRCYESQWDTNTVEWIVGQNKTYGIMAWCDYAESFVTGLPLVGTRWNRKAGSILLDLQS